MKISPLPAAGMPAPQAQVNSDSPSIKMRVQRSPEKLIEALASQQTETPTEPQSPETNTNVEAQEPEERRPLSPELASIAKMRRSLQVKERELAQKEEALKAQSQTGSGEDFMAKLKANPLSVLQESGVTYDELTEAILSNPINPEISQLKKDLNALKEELSQQFTSRDKQAESQVLGQMRKEATELAKEGETYQFIREAQMEEDVVSGIHEHFIKTGEVLDLVETMNKLEERLVENTLKATQIKKVQQRLSPASLETKQEMPNSQATKPLMRTLTSRDNARPTDQDRKARAMAAFYGQLRKG